MAAPGSGGVATAAAADAAGTSGGSNASLDQATGAATSDDHVPHHHPAVAAAAGGADAGEHHSSLSTPQHPHPHQQQQQQQQAQPHPANGGGEGVCPQTHLSETAPSWSAADERHAAAHAHEEATARTADAMLRGRAGTPVETQITSDEEAGTSSSDDEQRAGNGSAGSSGTTNQGQQNNNQSQQQQQGGEQLLAAKALAAVAATAGVRAAKQQQQQQQQALNVAGVHRSRAGSTASSTAGSGMGIGMAAAAEEMSVVLPEELRSVLEEVAKSGRSNQLPWMISPGDAADTAMESATSTVEKNGVETSGDIPVPLPFCGIESRRKRKRLSHTSNAEGETAVSVTGQGESIFGGSPGVGRKRPRPTPGSDLVTSEGIFHENDDYDGTAEETSSAPPQFRSLRNVLQVSLALVLDGAYRVCSERSGIGYRPCQAEREAWDRKRSGGSDTKKEDSTDNVDDGAANGSYVAMENGSSSSDGIAGISPARPLETMKDDEEKNVMAISPADLGKEMYLDRRAKLLAMLNVEQEGTQGNRKNRGGLVPPEEYGPVEPPFTIQRICEILVAPTKYYSQTHKLCNALEKLLLITSPEGSFGGAGSPGEDEEDGRYESGSIPEEEDLDLRKIVARESPTKFGDTADTELPLQFSSQQQNEEYRRHIQEQRQNQSAALTSAASSGLNDRFAFATSSSGGPGSQGLDIDGDSHLATIGGGEHVGAEASTLDARSEQELRQTISSSLEGAGTEIAPGHLIARAPSPVLFANGANSSGSGLNQSSADHRVIGMRGEGLSEAAARQQSSSGMRERSGSVEAAEPIDFMVASKSRATALQRQQERGGPDTGTLRDADGQTGHLSASNSEDGDVDDSMESGDDLSIDDSASDRSDRSDRSDGADSDTGSHIPNIASGTGLPGTGLSVAAMGTNLHAVGTSAPYGYEPFAAARVLALNRIHQQQQRQEQFLQSRALAAVAAGAHAAASAANVPPGVGQQSGLGSSIGLGAAQQHQHLGAHNNFRPPPDSEYQSGDSIDSTRAEDSCESDSSASDMND